MNDDYHAAGWTTTDTCTFCGHDINHHGTTQVGCADCSCGFDADFHCPDPPRGDE